MNNIDPRLYECQKRIRYEFRDPALLQTALTHSTAATNPATSNERMEFLGDAVLGAVISESLYRRYPDHLEGVLSIIRGNVVSRRACSRIGRRLGLESCVILGRGVDSVPDSILANLVESLIAAVYLDAGIATARRFVEWLFHDELTVAENEIDRDNFKSLLQQEVHQTHPNVAPGYHLVDEKGPDHQKCFKIQVKIGVRPFQSAWANSKKEAEQKAAENALSQLRGESPPWSDGE